MSGDVIYTGEVAFWCFVVLVLVGNALFWWVFIPMLQREAFDRGRSEGRKDKEFHERTGDMAQAGEEE